MLEFNIVTNVNPIIFQFFTYPSKNRMKQFLTFLMVLLFNPSHLFAQEGDCTFSIVGKVLDKDTSAPIPFATIRVAGVEKYRLELVVVPECQLHLNRVAELGYIAVQIDRAPLVNPDKAEALLRTGLWLI